MTCQIPGCSCRNSAHGHASPHAAPFSAPGIRRDEDLTIDAQQATEKAREALGEALAAIELMMRATGLQRSAAQGAAVASTEVAMLLALDSFERIEVAAERAKQLVQACVAGSRVDPHAVHASELGPRRRAEFVVHLDGRIMQCEQETELGNMSATAAAAVYMRGRQAIAHPERRALIDQADFFASEPVTVASRAYAIS